MVPPPPERSLRPLTAYGAKGIYKKGDEPKEQVFGD